MPEDDFDDFELDDDDDEFGEPDPEDISNLRSSHNLPVFKKAMQIAELTKVIVDTFDKEKDELNMSEQMMLNAYMLGAKISGAEAGSLYTIRMENAMIIKIHARELVTQTSVCKMEKLCDVEYLDMLRREIEEFRVLFIEWVKGFDKTDDIKDEWDILDL